MQRRTLLIPLSLLGGLAIALLLARTCVPPEPTYEGHRLSEWLLSYQEGVDLPYQTKPVEWMGKQPTAKQAEAAAAVRHIGASAVPHLLRWLQYKPPAWRAGAANVVSRLPSSTVTRCIYSKVSPPPYDWVVPNRALLVKSLTNCLQDTNGSVRGKALDALAWIAPEALTNAPAR